MSKIGKVINLRLSNLAHLRLKNKYGKLTSESFPDDYKNVQEYGTKMLYHSGVLAQQLKEKRVLSEPEKTEIYKNCDDFFVK